MGKNITDKESNGIHLAMFEHNVFIVWKPEYNLGIPIIDEQHRGIVTIINSLHFGMQNDYAKDILTPIISMMNDYTHIHFSVEESFIEMIDFPNAKKHHELHRELMSKLTHTGMHSMIDRDPRQFMDFMKNWWINHICNEDLTFRNYHLSEKKE